MSTTRQTSEVREGRARAGASRSEPGGRGKRGAGGAPAAAPLAGDLPVEVRERLSDELRRSRTRSNSVRAPKTWKMRLPLAVVVSMCSCRLRRRMLRADRLPAILQRGVLLRRGYAGVAERQ